jgi:hypothetical protein
LDSSSSEKACGFNFGYLAKGFFSNLKIYKLNSNLKEVRNNTDNERLINLIYLANDVIQNARKKAPSFMNAFYEVLQPAVRYKIEINDIFNLFILSHITNTVDSSHRKKLERILDVWRERQIYKNEQLDVLYQALAESSISSPTNLNSDPESPTNYRGSPSSSSHGKRPNSPITSPQTAKVFNKLLFLNN